MAYDNGLSLFMKPESSKAKLEKIGRQLAENDQYKTMKYGYHIYATFLRDKTFTSFDDDTPRTLTQIQEVFDSLRI